METVGIQPDGTLWISDKPEKNKWTPGTLHQFGSETNWRQLAQGSTSVVLLKTDGTLWRWGCVTNELHHWPGLRTFTPYQIGTNSDWQELFTLGGIFARQTDGRVWRFGAWIGKPEKMNLMRATNYDEIVLQTASRAGDDDTAFVRADGTLWVLNRYWDEKSRQIMGTGILQVGKENDWRAVAINYRMMVALKADGSLWQWNFQNGTAVKSVNASPTRLGIHDDWVAITGRLGMCDRPGCGRQPVALAGQTILRLRNFVETSQAAAIPRQRLRQGKLKLNNGAIELQKKARHI